MRPSPPAWTSRRCLGGGPALSAMLWSAPVHGERLRVPTLKTPSSASAGVAGGPTDPCPEPPTASIAQTMFPEFRRQFCDDQVLRKTLQELAGKFGTALLDKLKQPAHRADIFRYVILYLRVSYRANSWSSRSGSKLTISSRASSTANPIIPCFGRPYRARLWASGFRCQGQLGVQDLLQVFVGSAEERHGAGPNGGVESQSHLRSNLPFPGALRQEANEDLRQRWSPLCDGQWHSGCLHNMLEMAEGIPRGSHHQGVHRQNAAIKLGGYHA